MAISEIPYTSRDFQTIYDELESLIQQTRPDLYSDFFQANLGTLLVELLAVVGDDTSFNTDIVSREFFLATLRRYASALRDARSVGYIPRSATAAEVTVKDVSLPDAVTTNGATIDAGAALIGPNGFTYELLEDAVIPAGSTTSRLSLFEGVSYNNESFAPTSRPDQEVTTENFVVADGTWEVYVGDPDDPADLWDQVLNVALEVGATETYQVGFTGEGQLVVIFGNGTNGKIPDDTITVKYRTTHGADGNAPIYAVSGSIQAELIGGLGTVSITYTNSESASTGGRDRESVDEMRVNIPAYIRSVDKIVTLLDYSSNVLRVAGVALAFADVSVASYSANIIKVHVWDEETVDFTSESPVGAVRSTVDYERYAVISTDRLNELQAFLLTRTLETVHNTVEQSDVAWVDLYFSTITFDSQFEREDVHTAITEAVVAVFETLGGFAIRIADLYDAVRDVAGVRYFTLDRVVFEHKTGTRATGTVELTANPTDGDYVQISDGGSSVTFEFDDNAAVTGGHIPVTIGANEYVTIDNLLSAVRDNLSVLANNDLSGANPVLNIENKTAGEDYNIPITKLGAAVVVTGMTGGSGTLATHIEDHRRIQDPAPDSYPPGSYAPGEPFVPAGPAWQDGGQLPYEEIEDIEVEATRTIRRYYDYTYLYNNEIYYNSGLGEASGIQAINLRRLVFELTSQ